jgi:L-asparagine oxygenase
LFPTAASTCWHQLSASANVFAQIGVQSNAVLQSVIMLSALNRAGFILLQEFESPLSTLELARRIGNIVEIERLLPASGVPTVQTLTPRDTMKARRNQYSGNYGLDRFPLHTDLAHWVLPPRYFLLRCVVGTEDVYTTIFPSARIVDLLGRPALGKAVFKGRRRAFGCSGLVRALSSHQHAEIFRWDPVFLEPLSKHAYALKRVMDDPVTFESQMNIKLAKAGDTIIVDNWQTLHGRSAVTLTSTTRHVERVYLSEVFDDS